MPKKSRSKKRTKRHTVRKTGVRKLKKTRRIVKKKGSRKKPKNHKNTKKVMKGGVCPENFTIPKQSAYTAVTDNNLKAVPLDEAKNINIKENIGVDLLTKFFKEIYFSRHGCNGFTYEGKTYYFKLQIEIIINPTLIAKVNNDLDKATNYIIKFLSEICIIAIFETIKAYSNNPTQIEEKYIENILKQNFEQYKLNNKIKNNSVILKELLGDLFELIRIITS